MSYTFANDTAEVSNFANVKLIFLLTQEVRRDATCAEMSRLGLCAVTL